MFRRVMILFCACCLSACAGLSVPQATPTVAPTRTPTPTIESTVIALEPSRTSIPSATASATAIPASATAIPPTATQTPTLTLIPSATDTNAPTATHTLTLTVTNTATLTPSHTPTAITPTSPPSITPLPTLGPTSTLPPTSTPTASQTSRPVPTRIPPTRTPNLTATVLEATNRAPTLTLAPTITLTPSLTLVPPTLDVTPTFILTEALTPIPPEIAETLPAVISTDTTVETAATPTFPPAPTVANVQPPPTLSIISFNNTNPTVITRAFALGGGGAFSVSNGISNPTLFVPNPVFANSYLMTDETGLIFEVNGGERQRFTGGQFPDTPTSRADNNHVIVDAVWSPDGRAVAIIVDSWSVDNQATSDDGVWFYVPGEVAPTQLLVHCPPNAADQCQITQIPGVPYTYIARSIVWSPNSQFILAEADGFDIGRRVLFVLSRGTSRSNRPNALYYEYGDWSGDGQRIVVSGRGPDGRVVLGSVALDGSDEQIVLDGSAVGLWLQDGVQRPDGTLVALGRAGDANGPMQIYNQNGIALTDVIGTSRPVVVKWSPGRSAVYVQTEDGRKFVADVNGGISEITNQVGDIRAVNWGRQPPDSGTGVAIGTPPAGVIEGARLQPGQQLRVNSNTGQLNLREGPSRSANSIGLVTNGEYVAILAGPTEADGVEWWRVQIANGQQGWIAGRINGFDVLVP